MTNENVTEFIFITDKKAREENIDRVEVLDKVGTLFLLPNTELASTKQVTKFYEVPLKTLNSVIYDHKDELTSDGMKKYSRKEVESLNLGKGDIERTQYSTTIKAKGGNVNLSNAGLNLFPKRAILRVGMLLRDSEVAKEVRSQLLNVVEHVQEESPHLLTQDITEEKLLMIEVGQAMLDGDVQALIVANTKLNEFKNRHINNLEEHVQELETKVDTLTDGIVNYDGDLKELFKICVRSLDNKRNLPYGVSYNEIYRNLAEQTGIDVYARKRNSGLKKPYLHFIMVYEWNEVIKVTMAYCESCGIDMKGLFENKKELTTV